MLTVQSLFQGLASHDSCREEIFTTLLDRPGVKLERIASHRQASPEGFWYDQETEEWVLLLRGEALLEMEGQPPLELRAGDHFTIPAHIRHRVARTSPDALWLALHVTPL